jgi:hypothetical protein
MNVDTNFNITSNNHYGTVTGETAGNGLRLSNGNYVIGGVTNNGPNPWDGNVIYTNNSGSVQWGKYIVGTGQDFVETSDNNILTIGRDAPFTLVKLDQSGNILFSKSYAATTYVSKIIKTADGGYATIGNTTQYSTDGLTSDAILIKFDASLNIVWSKIYGVSNSAESFMDIFQKNEGGFLLAM